MTIQLPLQNPIAVAAHSRRLNSGEQEVDRAEEGRRLPGSLTAAIDAESAQVHAANIEIHTYLAHTLFSSCYLSYQQRTTTLLQDRSPLPETHTRTQTHKQRCGRTRVCKSTIRKAVSIPRHISMDNAVGAKLESSTSTVPLMN